jgi:tRNA G10  N-methylase Trm11
MGYDVCGTDLEPRMTEYSQVNLDWLKEKFSLGKYSLSAADATEHEWSPLPQIIASEVYLGRPFTSKPSSEILSQTISDCNLIIKRFLQNIAKQTKPGVRLCLAIPAWQTKPQEFKHLPFLDHLDDLGYNRLSFEQVRTEDLVYARLEQIVGRELLVITRN